MCTTSSPELGVRCRVPGSTTRFRSVASMLVPAACLFLGHALVVSTAASSDADIAHVRVVETDDFIDAPERGMVAFPIDADSVVALRTSAGDAAHVELMSQGDMPRASDNLRLSVDNPFNVSVDALSASVQVFDTAPRAEAPVSLSRGGGRGAARLVPNLAAIASPVGVAVDPDDGGLFVLDSGDWSVTKLGAASDPRPGLGSAGGRQWGSRVVLANPPSRALAGLVYDAAYGSLYTIDASTRGLYRIDPDGSLERMGTFPAEHWSEPRAVVLAPSLDRTDDPKRWHLFVLTSEGADGEVHEWSIPRGESESS